MSLYGLHEAKPTLGGGEIERLHRKYPLILWGSLSPSDIDEMRPQHPDKKREIVEKIMEAGRQAE